MQEFLTQMDPNLIYDSHTIEDDTIYIKCHTPQIPGRSVSNKRYRKIKDINYGTKKVILLLLTRRYKPTADSPNYISDSFEFILPTGHRTKRLNELLLNLVSGNDNLLSIEKTLRSNIANISDSTLARIVVSHSKKNL